MQKVYYRGGMMANSVHSQNTGWKPMMSTTSPVTLFPSWLRVAPLCSVVMSSHLCVVNSVTTVLTWVIIPKALF